MPLTDIADEDELFFTASMVTEDGQAVGPSADDGKPERFKIYKGHFDDHVRFDPEREQRDYRKKRGCIEAVWGWAITCHKSQGSQCRAVQRYLLKLMEKMDLRPPRAAA